MNEGRIGVLCRFQQLRSYRDETETWKREEVPFKDSEQSVSEVMEKQSYEYIGIKARLCNEDNSRVIEKNKKEGRNWVLRRF